MDQLLLKQKIINQCRKIIHEKADELRVAMQEAQKAANDYGPPRDRYDAFRSQLLRKRDMFGQQLAKINEQIEALEKIDPHKICDKVSYGSIVITETQKMFISTGIGKIEVEGETYFAISGIVPIFKMMEGKQAGDEFIFNAKKIKILEVF